jgi:hypothetical protein
MPENVIKLRCQVCAGKIALDEDYYRELIGHTVACPHCQAEVPVPAHVEQSKPKIEGVHSADNTQPLGRTVGNLPASGPAGIRKCPFCNDGLGPRDRFCIKCGKKLPPG